MSNPTPASRVYLVDLVARARRILSDAANSGVAPRLLFDGVEQEASLSDMVDMVTFGGNARIIRRIGDLVAVGCCSDVTPMGS